MSRPLIIPPRSGGFTLVELLIVVAIVATLVSIVLPAIGGVFELVDDTRCKSNLRVLGSAVANYASANQGYFPPMAYPDFETNLYWWGTNEDPPDYDKGPLYPYLGRKPGEEGDGNAFECPSQPWGSYVPQGAARAMTTTYGYNGYYLTPRAASWWSGSIGHRPWKTVNNVPEAGKVFVLADTMLSWGNGVVTNNCLLDPPWLYFGGRWSENASTTLCFRHGGHANVLFADWHVEGVEPTTIIDHEAMTGYVGESNAPHYVPDWEDW